jgi:hypothetical protein
MIKYWDSQKGMTSAEKLDGLAFSFLTLIDGSTLNMPAMNIVLRPHPDDKQFLIMNDEDWFVDGMTINDDATMHDEWSAVNRAANRKKRRAK